MFERASRVKLRFESAQGLLSVEDLWDVPMVSSNPNKASLDNIAKNIYKQLKDENTESFVTDTSKASELLQFKFDIVKYVIEIRKAEAEKIKEQRENKERKQKIADLIQRKKDEHLSNLSVEELENLLKQD